MSSYDRVSQAASILAVRPGGGVCHQLGMEYTSQEAGEDRMKAHHMLLLIIIALVAWYWWTHRG